MCTDGLNEMFRGSMVSDVAFIADYRFLNHIGNEMYANTNQNETQFVIVDVSPNHEEGEAFNEKQV